MADNDKAQAAEAPAPAAPPPSAAAQPQAPQPEPKKETILAEAHRIVNGQRRDDYGGPFESFSDIAAGWSFVLGVPVTPEQVGLCMIQLKVARAKNGGFHRDSFVDIAGYAQCMEFIAEARAEGK